MIVKGRDHPIVNVRMDETGILTLRIDFELNLAGWVVITLLNEDLEKLQRGNQITGEEDGKQYSRS